LPILEPLTDPRLLAVRYAVVRCIVPHLAVAKLVEQAAVPSSSRFEINLEADAAICIDWSRPVPPYQNGHLPAEVLVAIDGPQPRSFLQPFRRDPAATHNIARLHLE